MGRKGVSKRKPKRSKAFDNAHRSSANSGGSGGGSQVQTLVKDKGAPVNKGGMHPVEGSTQKSGKGK